MSLKGKVALVTEGGRHFAAGKVQEKDISSVSLTGHVSESLKQLVKEEANLALHHTLGQSRVTALHMRDTVLKAHPDISISIHGGDLGTAAAVERLFSEVLAEHGRIDVVVTAAGVVAKGAAMSGSEAE